MIIIYLVLDFLESFFVFIENGSNLEKREDLVKSLFSVAGDFFGSLEIFLVYIKRLHNIFSHHLVLKVLIYSLIIRQSMALNGAIIDALIFGKAVRAGASRLLRNLLGTKNLHPIQTHTSVQILFLPLEHSHLQIVDDLSNFFYVSLEECKLVAGALLLFLDGLQTQVNNTFNFLFDIFIIDLQLPIIHLSMGLNKKLSDVSSFLDFGVKIIL